MRRLLKIGAMALPTCAMFALAQPAGAADGGPAGGSPATTASASSATTAVGGKAGAAREQKYCYFMDPPTGSRVPEHKCRTKAEWLAAGFDISRKK